MVILMTNSETQTTYITTKLISFLFQYVIHDKVLLVKSLVVLLIVMICFFIHPFVNVINIGLGWYKPRV